MSHEASSWAWEQVLPTARKFVLTCLANSADEYGVTILGQKRVADRCGLKVRQVQNHISALRDGGWIAKVERRRGNGSRTSDYTVLAPSSHHSDRELMRTPDPEEYPAAVIALCTHSTAGSTGAGHTQPSAGLNTQPSAVPEPSEEPSDSPDSPLIAVAQQMGLGVTTKLVKSVSYRGKRVAPTMVMEAVGILDEFNSQAETTYRAFTRTGRMTDELSRIIGVLLDYDPPSWGWKEMIRRNLRNRWWGDEQPRVGHVFGPKVISGSLVNDGRQRGDRNGADPAPAGTGERLMPGMPGWVDPFPNS